jgi:hypothetical protein
MTSRGSLDTAPSSNDPIWTFEYLVDNMFVNLMENGYGKNTKLNKYIHQVADKFDLFRIRSPTTFFEINKKDLSNETLKQLEDYAKQGCKTKGERYQKLDGLFTEVIALIAKQAESKIISSRMGLDTVWVKRSVHEIREFVSFRWILVDGNKKEESKNE